MESKINQILSRFYTNKITKIEKKIMFLKSYKSILINTYDEKTKAKIDLFKIRHDEKLIPFCLKAKKDLAMIDELYLQAKQNEEKRYFLAKKALNQTKKRYISRNKDISCFVQKEEKLQQKHLSRLLNLSHKYYLHTDANNKDITIYQEVKTRLDQQLSQKMETVINKQEIYVNRITKKYDKQVIVLSNKKEKLMSKLKTIPQPTYDLSDDAILKVENLSMHFGGLKAVDNLSFEVKKGEIFGLIGPNGAGKTTVFNCITRFYKATSGEIVYRNPKGEIINLNQYKVHNVIKEGIVRTFQNVELIWEISVLDNLLLAAHTQYQTGLIGQLFSSYRLRQEEKVLKAKAEAILAKLNLTMYTHLIPFGLPYGILKKIELARTLMTNPNLIILDEPAAGLNDTEKVEFVKTLKQIKEEYNATIFLVEHDMGLVMGLCNTVCAISFGKMLAIDTPEKIKVNKKVQEAYLGGE